MTRAGLDEQGAFRRMRKLAMDQNLQLGDIAQMILTAEQAFTPPATT